MQYGRHISPQDRDILKELQSQWRDDVKIDFDIVHEPCIFYNYFGAWNIVYKLSKDGSYLQNRWHYVLHAHEAILSFLREQKAVSYEQEKKYQEKFYEKRKEIETKGFQDNIKEE
jgi:hypothetical protein